MRVNPPNNRGNAPGAVHDAGRADGVQLFLCFQPGDFGRVEAETKGHGVGERRSIRVSADPGRYRYGRRQGGQQQEDSGSAVSER